MGYKVFHRYYKYRKRKEDTSLLCTKLRNKKRGLIDGLIDWGKVQAYISSACRHGESLVISEHIDSGDSMEKLKKVLSGADIQYDTCTLSLSESTIYRGDTIIGSRGNSGISLFYRPILGLTGVYKKGVGGEPKVLSTRQRKLSQGASPDELQEDSLYVHTIRSDLKKLAQILALYFTRKHHGSTGKVSHTSQDRVITILGTTP